MKKIFNIMVYASIVSSMFLNSVSAAEISQPVSNNPNLNIAIKHDNYLKAFIPYMLIVNNQFQLSTPTNVILGANTPYSTKAMNAIDVFNKKININMVPMDFENYIFDTYSNWSKSDINKGIITKDENGNNVINIPLGDNGISSQINPDIKLNILDNISAANYLKLGSVSSGHTYSIYNVRSSAGNWFLPINSWSTANSVSFSQILTVSSSINSSIPVSDIIGSIGLGISGSTTKTCDGTFNIPRGYKGRIILSFSRYDYTFDTKDINDLTSQATYDSGTAHSIPIDNFGCHYTLQLEKQ